jgi:RNA polymerase sigma factor (sigma-70 family)
MEGNIWLVEAFEEHRGRLRNVASRMLGSATDAEDALQEAWIRFSRSDMSAVENLGGWLTTVVSRVCLDMLSARRRLPGTPFEEGVARSIESDVSGTDPEQEAILADSVGLALMIMLDKLTPAERVSLVLHDMFAVPFEEIGPIVGRSVPAARQLASRARRRIRGHPAPAEADRILQATLVEAFLAAARQGDVHALLFLLDPDVVLRADEAAVALGAPAQARGAEQVAGFLRRARGAQSALVDGEPGMVWAPGGQPRVILKVTVSHGKIAEIDAVANPGDMERLDVVVT